MTWLMILCMAAITFVNRYAFFTDLLRYQPGVRARRFLSYSTYAVLTAIWTPIVFQFDYQQGFSHAGGDYLIAVTLAAMLTILRVKSIIVVLASTALFFVLRFAAFAG